MRRCIDSLELTRGPSALKQKFHHLFLLWRVKPLWFHGAKNDTEKNSKKAQALRPVAVGRPLPQSQCLEERWAGRHLPSNAGQGVPSPPFIPQKVGETT